MLSLFGLLRFIFVPRPLAAHWQVVHAEQDPGDDFGRSSNNRPNNGSRGVNDQRPRQEGPPDLDELWQDFDRRIRGLLRMKPKIKYGRHAPQPPESGDNGSGMKGGAQVGVGIIAVVIMLLWLASGFFIVQEGQVGVILQFGEYKSTTKAGFQWRWPYPIQSHEIVDISRVRTVEVGYRQNVKTRVLRESLMLTDDENIIDIQFAVQYRLKDAAEFLFNNRNPEEAVMQAAETAVREVVGRNKMDFVLYEGRESVAVEINNVMQRILDRYKTGVLISSVTIQNAQPPEQVQAAFDDAVKASQDRERQKSEGQAYANDVIPKARGAAERLNQEAEGYKQRTIAQAQGDAMRFKQILVEYSKAPAVTRDRMYLDAMQQIFTNTSKVLIDSKTNNNLLYLPLDKLIQQSAAQDSSKTPASASSTSTTGPSSTANPTVASVNPNGETDTRSLLRNRDREVR